MGVVLVADVPSNGTFSATGVRASDSAAVTLTGKADGQKLILDYQNRFCHSRAELARH